MSFFNGGGGEVLVYFCQCFEKCHQLSRTVSRFVKLAHWRVIEREHLACSSHLETLLLSPTPRQLRFHFFTSLWEGRNRTRPGRGLLRSGPRRGHNMQLPRAGSKQSRPRPLCRLCCTELLVEHWPFRPHSGKGTLTLQSLWFALVTCGIFM